MRSRASVTSPATAPSCAIARFEATPRQRSRVALAACAALLLVALASAARVLPAQQPLPFDSAIWHLDGDARRVTAGGQAILELGTGLARTQGLGLEDGTVDAEVWMTRLRTFAFLSVRMQDDSTYESFYLRPHKSGLPDAVQYTPVYQGEGQWQLYHGPGRTAAATLDEGRWVPLRLVLLGRRAALFVGDTARPVLVSRLALDARAGDIELRAFIGAGLPPEGVITRFRNVKVRRGRVAFAFPPEAPTAPPAPGIVRAWAVSRARFASDTARTRVEAEFDEPRAVLPVNDDGVLELHRFLPLPERTARARDVGALARVTLTAARAGTRVLELGYSDAVTVFLNGEPVYYGDEGYDYARRREGLLRLGQAVLYLPLRAGANRLEVVVTDHFGGWALAARLRDAAGVQVTAP
ncbi:MAG: hypothetical protein HY275_07000 [Gemmatimonadetes bacterium]|nr:hypothetical protein [Gemmatimonadota bacterium]